MAWSVHVLAVWWCVVDMRSNGWRGQCTCWQCGGVWWTWDPMDGVVSARAGSVVVCGGHGIQWMAWSVHVLAVWWCVVYMGSNGWRGQCMCWQCGRVWWTWGPMDGVVGACAGSVVCGGHRVEWMAWSVHMLAVWYVVDIRSNGWRGQCTCWQCGGVWLTWSPMDGVVSARAGSVVCSHCPNMLIFLPIIPFYNSTKSTYYSKMIAYYARNNFKNQV